MFISHIRPHKGVTRATISTWVKEILKKTGVDTSKFKSHSTRVASTSKAEFWIGVVGLKRQPGKSFITKTSKFRLGIFKGQSLAVLGLQTE